MNMKCFRPFGAHKLPVVHIAMIMGLFLLNGCASPTADDVRSTPAESASFFVPLAPKMVYQNVINRVGPCLVYGSRYASLVKKELVPKVNYTVEVHMAGIGLGTELVIDIKGNSKGTDVTYYRNSGYGALTNIFHDFHQLMVDSANDQGEGC